MCEPSRRSMTLVLATCLAVGGAHAAEPCLILHVLDRNPPDPCEAGAGALGSCDDVEVASTLTPMWVYLAAVGIDTLGGASFNLEARAGLTIESVEGCGGVDLLFARGTECIWATAPDPAPLGQGADGITGIAVIEVSGTGTLEVTPCFENDFAILWDGDVSRFLSQARLGRANLDGPESGYSPCRTEIPVAAVSWSAVKATYTAAE